MPCGDHEFLRDFKRLMEGVTLVAGGAAGQEARQLQEEVQSLLRDKILFESENSRPLLIAVVGGTNVGKSTVVNLVVGEERSAISALARGTKTPVVCAAEPTLQELEDQGFLHDVTLARSNGPTGLQAAKLPTVKLSRTQGFPSPGVLLVDSPDMDSEFARNRAWAHRLLDVADAIILVVTPEKYNDEVVIQFLRAAVSRGREMAAVFNKYQEDDAYEDFLRTVWRKSAGNTPVVNIPWCTDGICPVDRGDAIREIIELWASERVAVKIRALEGSINEMKRGAETLGDFFMREQEWLMDKHRAFDGALAGVIETYREDISGEKFAELDRVFARLLHDLRIPVLDDFYGGIRAIGRTVWSRLGALAGFSTTKEQEATERRARERDRIRDACELLRTGLQRTVQEVPVAMRSAADAWSRAIPPSPGREKVAAYLSEVDMVVERWVEEETEAMAKKLAEKPGLRTFLVASKATLQIGSGVLGAVLTGGLDPTDLALIPAFERLSAYLIERGIGYSHFRRCRARLLDLRADCLEEFLAKSLVNAVRAEVPAPREELADELSRAIEAFPQARELL